MANGDDKDMTTRMMLEQIRDDIKKLGDGVADMERRLTEKIADMGRDWDNKWSPHDLAIRNHGRRIATLERRRPRPSRS